MNRAFLFLQQVELFVVSALFTTVLDGQHSVRLRDGGDDVPGGQEGVKVSREILKIFDSCKIGKAVAVRAGFERIF